jgi:uncharacterized protein (TIGR02217 family)
LSLPVFSSPATMAWSSTKTQIWDTKIQRHGNGRRKTLARWLYPEYEINCSYTCLNQAEVDYVAGFFGIVRGQAFPWLWKDPEDFRQTKVQIGIGDGANTGFQLLRNLSGLFVEPVSDIVPGTLLVFVNDTSVSATLGDDGWVTINAPATESIVTATFEYYWRVAFADDEMTWENFWYSFYKLKSVKLVTVK